LYTSAAIADALATTEPITAATTVFFMFTPNYCLYQPFFGRQFFIFHCYLPNESGTKSTQFQPACFP
ncbi:hypothetical protein ACOV11_28140, partial [Vibrio natriegens]